MKVQEFKTNKNNGYLLLDDDYKVIPEVKEFMKFLYPTKSPNTLRAYCNHLMLFYEFCDAMDYEPLKLCSDPEHKPMMILSEFVTWLQYPEYVELGVIEDDRDAERTPRTVNAIVAAVLMFYQYLAMNDQIYELPVYTMTNKTQKYKPFLHELTKNIKKVRNSILTVKYAPKEVEPITRETYNKLFNACTTRRDKILVGLLYECGLRINEALGLHLSPDLDKFQDREILIVPRENNENGARVKRYAEGSVSVPPYLQSLINEYLIYDVPNYDSDFLFLTMNGKTKGHPMKYQNAYDLFKRLSDKIGEDVHPHMLRHGFAQEKLDNGWKLEEIQSYLRHKNPASTTLYAKMTEQKKKELITKFYEQREAKLNPDENK